MGPVKAAPDSSVVDFEDLTLRRDLDFLVIAGHFDVDLEKSSSVPGFAFSFLQTRPGEALLDRLNDGQWKLIQGNVASRIGS